MNKSQIVNKMISVIEDYAEKYKLEVSDPVYGEAFKNSIWEGLIKDDSDIPHIIASNEDMSIELRSFWGSPELDIRVDNNYESRLMCVNYHENKKTHEYEVDLFRVNGDDYKRSIDELEGIIKFIESEEV